jgi:hypothetical protein
MQEQIKGLLPGLMLSTPPRVRAQLSEALSVISGHDFPARWPALLPELIQRLRSGSAAEVAGVLETANSIYKRYRNAFMSDALSRELAYSQQLVEPLLAALQVCACVYRGLRGSSSTPIPLSAVHASRYMQRGSLLNFLPGLGLSLVKYKGEHVHQPGSCSRKAKGIVRCPCSTVADPGQLHACAQAITKRLKGAPGEPPPGAEQAAQALGAARLVMRIFFSLNSPGLTEVAGGPSAHPLHTFCLPYKEPSGALMILGMPWIRRPCMGSTPDAAHLKGGGSMPHASHFDSSAGTRSLDVWTCSSACSGAQEFEAVLDAWMGEFHYYLTYENPSLAEGTDADAESPVDAVKAAVCANINLFMELNEEEFAKYLGTFAQDVWTQLTRVTLRPGQARGCLCKGLCLRAGGAGAAACRASA